MSNIYGTFSDAFVTIDTEQDVTGKKRFLNLDNEFDGTLVQPTILAEAEVIDTTEISFLAGASSNIQAQFAGINIVLTGLTALEQALQAIEPAPNATTVQFNNSILLDDGTGLTATLNTNSLLFADPNLNFNGAFTESAAVLNIGSKTSSLTAVSLQFVDTNYTGNFMFQTNDNFFKWDAGVSFRTDIDDHHVNKDMSFKVVNGGGQVDFQNYEYYLDENGLAGWSVIISEGSGTDATIKNPDGLWFYGHGIAGYTQQSDFPLKKWATARITLVPSTTFAPGFAWAVSMY